LIISIINGGGPTKLRTLKQAISLNRMLALYRELIKSINEFLNYPEAIKSFIR